MFIPLADNLNHDNVKVIYDLYLTENGKKLQSCGNYTAEQRQKMLEAKVSYTDKSYGRNRLQKFQCLNTQNMQQVENFTIKCSKVCEVKSLLKNEFNFNEKSSSESEDRDSEDGFQNEEAENAKK